VLAASIFAEFENGMRSLPLGSAVEIHDHESDSYPNLTFALLLPTDSAGDPNIREAIEAYVEALLEDGLASR
jgi:hypothetical protein